MTDWQEIEFRRLCKITRGASPRPIHNWMTERDDGIPWIKISDATSSYGRTIKTTSGKIFKEGKEKSVFVTKGDLILSNSATPGLPMFVGMDACIHDGWLLLRDFKESDKLFLFYLLRHERSNLVSQGSGTVFTNLKTDILKNHTVKIPPIQVQKSVARILGTLDDKIELNQEIIQILGEIAKAIFKSWFVDFDPVRAKVEGRPTGLPSEISDLFPDEMVESEFGEIPKGWKVDDIGNYFECLDRKRIPLPRNERSKRSGNIPYYGATGIIGWVDEHIFDGTFLLVGEDGSVENEDGTAFSQYVSGKIWVNNHAHVLMGKESISTEFLFLLFQFVKVTPYVTGAVQMKISQKNLRSIPILIPSVKILEYFQSLVSLMFEERILREREIITLNELRDTLLPKLISGELRIPDAKKLIEKAGM